MNLVITGASAGIGRAMAVTFATHGHAVLAIARREDRLIDLRDSLCGVAPSQVHYLPLDITAPGAPVTLLKHAETIFGKVHGLINCAGMSPYLLFKDIPYDTLKQIIDLDVLALTQLCHLFQAHMLAHGEPSHIVNVSSVGGYAPLPRFSVYTGAKHYVRVFTDLLNYETRGTNIQVSGIYPGGVLSEFPELAGQQISRLARATMFTPQQLAERTYPNIIKGKRVIIPGFVYQLTALIGKLLPFPWAIRITEAVYHQNIKPVQPTDQRVRGNQASLTSIPKAQKRQRK